MPDPESSKYETVVLGPNPEKNQSFFHTIARNLWFTRRLEVSDEEDKSEDIFALIGCTVVPGYHEEDIETKTFGELKASLKK